MLCFKMWLYGEAYPINVKEHSYFIFIYLFLNFLIYSAYYEVLMVIFIKYCKLLCGATVKVDDRKESTILFAQLEIFKL